MNKEQLIELYCGLEWPKWQDLDSAYYGRLRTMNGARRAAMHPLITADLKVSELGGHVWGRGHIVMSANFVNVPDTFAKILDTAKAARLANKWGGLFYDNHRFTSEDFKIMRSLGQHPGTSREWLCRVYSFRRLDILEGMGIILRYMLDQQYPKWSWYSLSMSSIYLLNELDGEA